MAFKDLNDSLFEVELIKSDRKERENEKETDVLS